MKIADNNQSSQNSKNNLQEKKDQNSVQNNLEKTKSKPENNLEKNQNSLNNLLNSKMPKKPDFRKIGLNLLTILVSFAIIFAIFFFNDNSQKKQTEQKTFSDLITEVRAGKVSKIKVSPDQSQFEVELYKDPQVKNRKEIETKIFPNISIQNGSTPLENIKNSLGKDELKIGSKDGEIIYEESVKQWYTKLWENGTFVYLLVLFGVLGLALFFVRKIADTNSRAISFGNSKARVYDELDTKDKVTFEDVAGNEEAKAELTEVVDFLKRPEEYARMGAKIPRGVLLMGSPGNGKTLMARAVAGEAQVPFFYVSGSEFVEMFVGVGAGRVRDLFKRAKKKNRCVIFIDEIDAVGRQRGAGLGGGNDEREQTLNQILVEMDGFEPSISVIVIGATNRPDVLDPALLRPGRFDRQVTVTAPDKEERKKILEVHSRGKRIEEDVNLDIIAKRTPGFSGADLMNILNEAAILAVRSKKDKVSNEDLREAIEKVALGPSLRSKIITKKQKFLTAYHEAGHALTATVLPQAQKVQKVTIIPRGRAAGYTFHADKEGDAMTKTKGQFLDTIVTLFGGYVVEELIFGDISTGASNDLAKATEIARDMVKKYGMSSLGPVSFQEDKGMTFLGRDMVEKQGYSEEIANKIDVEVNKIIQSCYQQCKQIIIQYRTYLDKIANALVEKEVLEYEEFTILVEDILVEEDDKLNFLENLKPSESF
jgi:cell division protease FtsH